MRPGTLFWKLFIGTSLLIVLVLGTCAWLIVSEVDRFYAEELSEHLTSQARLVCHVLRDRFESSEAQELDRLVKEWGWVGGHRITLISPDGNVLADSEADPQTMESHADRREVREALERGTGMDIHFSRSVRREMKYAAVRAGTAEKPIGVVRVSMPVRSVAERADAIQRIIWTITLLGLLAAILFALELARLWSNPIHRITAFARSLSRGDLSARARVGGGDEMGMLAQSLNEMRDHLAAQLRTIDRQRRTLESLLTQLHEGVVVAGPDGKIVLINPEAVRMMGSAADGYLNPLALRGQAVEQYVRQHELQRMLLSDPDGKGRPMLSVEDSTPGEMLVHEARIQVDSEDGELFVLARASDIVLPALDEETAVQSSKGRRTVARILVLTDITELARTVRVKSDFASNASHELRTPLSAIRAAVETLRDTDPPREPDTAQHFLGVIDRHSKRLEDLVSDLLNLSKIESSAGHPKVQTLNVRQVIADVHSRFMERLESKGLEWIVDVPPEMHSVVANPYLLRIVLDNLVDNGSKFTDRGGRITVSGRRVTDAREGGPAVIFAVADTGCGIAEDERDRVFERFYQVEKARSGSDRGTGLGLSIVRHAVAAMQGEVVLDSELGRGTTVTFTVPQPVTQY